MEVFLSYRRSDASSATGRLADRLNAALGPGRVFRDLDGIAPGADFEVVLQRAIGGAAVLLAVVGPGWLIASEDGRRRLDNPRDMVRREIEAAFAAGVTVVPVLVEGARMPTAPELPSELADFARCQAVELSDARWDDDCMRLFRLLHRQGLGPEPGAPSLRKAHARLLLDAVELLVHPRRVILAVAGRDGRDALVHAILLLLVSLASGNLLLAMVTFPDELPGTVFNGTLVGLVMSAFVVGCMMLGWRVVGTRSGWKIAAAASTCVVTGVWIYVFVILWLAALGMAFADPGIFHRMRAAVDSGGHPSAMLPSVMRSRPLHSALVFATVVFTAGLIWLVVAWNAARVALVRPRWAALAALVMVIALLGALIQTSCWVAQL